jgi:hypothetical protein
VWSSAQTATQDRYTQAGGDALAVLPLGVPARPIRRVVGVGDGGGQVLDVAQQRPPKRRLVGRVG